MPVANISDNDNFNITKASLVPSKGKYENYIENYISTIYKVPQKNEDILINWIKN